MRFTSQTCAVSRSIPALFVLGALAAAGLPRARAQQYELFVIDPFVPGSTAESLAAAIDERGEATGFATTNELRAYRWSVATGAVDLGEALGAISSHGDDVNFSGWVVGGSSGASLYDTAALWTAPNQLQILPAPSGAYAPFAKGINDRGMVVGIASISSNLTMGWIWDAQLGTRDLASLGVASCTSAVRINNRNQVVGQRLIGNYKAYRFDLDTQVLVDLGTLGGPTSEATGINEAGQVCGHTRNASFNLRPFLWSAAGGMRDLGALSGTSYDLGRAYDVNDAGQVVGSSNTVSGAAAAFVWDAVHGMRDLNALVVNPGGFELVSAVAINQSGWIAGNGHASTPGALSRGFVLRPIGAERIELYGFGDGSLTGCPCGNDGVPGHGCANSAFAAGSQATASGDASISADSFRLNATGLTGNTCVFFQGTTPIFPAIVDDGLGCVGGTLIRLGQAPVAGGASSFPQAGDPLVSVRGAIAPSGGTYAYQCFYRNAAATFCPPATSNRTNGVAATWVP